MVLKRLLKKAVAKRPTNLADFNRRELQQFIDSFDVVLTDCDGVLWLYDQVIEGSNNVINKFLDMGKKVNFITNNSTKSREDFVKMAREMNFNIGVDNMITSSYLAAQYLKQLNFNKKVFVVGNSGISNELDEVGIEHTGVGPDVLTGSFNDLDFMPDPDVGAVVVGFDEHISFQKIMKAATYLYKKDTIFVATNTDERHPLPNFVMPETGVMVRAVEACADRKAIVMGKPENLICDILFKNDVKRNNKKFLMIGDRLNTDMLFGNNNNFQTLLVGTGVHGLDEVDEIIEQVEDGAVELANQIPDFYVPKLGDLML